MVNRNFIINCDKWYIEKSEIEVYFEFLELYLLLRIYK